VVLKKHKSAAANSKTGGCILDVGVFIGGGSEGIRKSFPSTYHYIATDGCESFLEPVSTTYRSDTKLVSVLAVQIDLEKSVINFLASPKIFPQKGKVNWMLCLNVLNGVHPQGWGAFFLMCKGMLNPKGSAVFVRLETIPEDRVNDAMIVNGFLCERVQNERHWLYQSKDIISAFTEKGFVHVQGPESYNWPVSDADSVTWLTG
jgi:hypothetical protein